MQRPVRKQLVKKPAWEKRERQAANSEHLKSSLYNKVEKKEKKPGLETGWMGRK